MTDTTAILLETDNADGSYTQLISVTGALGEFRFTRQVPEVMTPGDRKKARWVSDPDAVPKAGSTATVLHSVAVTAREFGEVAINSNPGDVAYRMLQAAPRKPLGVVSGGGISDLELAPLPPSAPVEPAEAPADAAPTQIHAQTPQEPPVDAYAYVTDISQLIPDRSFFDSYLTRNVAPRYTDLDLLADARRMKQSVFLYGPAGSGKTSAPIAFAAREGIPVYVITCSAALDVVDVFGKYVPTGEGKLMWVYGKLVEVVRNGGIVVFDEATSMNPKVSPIFHSLTDFRRSITVNANRGEVIKAHPDLLVVATGNLGYVGTTPLNEAFRDRFDIQREWDYDNRLESKLVSSPTLVSVIKEIRKLCASQRIDVPVSTRALVSLDRQIQVQGFQIAMDNFAGRFEGAPAQAIRQVFKTFEANLQADYASTNIPTVSQALDQLSSKLGEMDEVTTG